MSHSVTIKIDTARNGQQERAYGPHVVDTTITITVPHENAVGSGYYLTEGYVQRVIKGLISGYCDGGEGHRNDIDHYFGPHLKELERVEFEERQRAVWHVRIETPFTD